MSQFWAFIGSIRWQDLVDITFNSYVLFRLYVLFRNTNAFRILAGIASVWLVQEMAASLGLILTSWALQAITAAAAIIIIVVFRNEIRSVLQARNFKAFFWGSPLREMPTPIETIVDTVFQMGKKRIGALIVIPGKEDLRELVHGGIPWNGTVSPEMLMSIFWPKNPVHDGAIVIQGNRVVEVGVLLPLSQRKDLPTFYGTRHRAARPAQRRQADDAGRGRQGAAEGRQAHQRGTAAELHPLAAGGGIVQTQQHDAESGAEGCAPGDPQGRG
jgi:uncharacterized protein (TIGR00159 family)